tara:strand:+ start:271 stop:516 length:246 start_codon:yes stop_codon:yes gene_type:complete
MTSSITLINKINKNLSQYDLRITKINKDNIHCAIVSIDGYSNQDTNNSANLISRILTEHKSLKTVSWMLTTNYWKSYNGKA